MSGWGNLTRSTEQSFDMPPWKLQFWIFFCVQETELGHIGSHRVLAFLHAVVTTLIRYQVYSPMIMTSHWWLYSAINVLCVSILIPTGCMIFKLAVMAMLNLLDALSSSHSKKLIPKSVHRQTCKRNVKAECKGKHTCRGGSRICKKGA